MTQNELAAQQKRTFRLELLRSIPQGVIETAGTTFAMYVAIRVFDAPVSVKILIAVASSIGLLLSLFSVQLVRRLGYSVNIASMVVWSLAALGFMVSAMASQWKMLYMIGVCIAAIMMTLGVPLMSQIYRKHYSNEVRGRLFSMGELLGPRLAHLLVFSLVVG